jgi:hypothetical protein
VAGAPVRLTMNTVATIQDLLAFNGSSLAVVIALTPSEQRVIEAAPEMLDALRYLLDNGTPLPTRLARCKAVLAKATGEA